MSSTITTYIRDAMYDRLLAAKIAQWKVTRKSPIPTLQIGDLPALGVFIMRENYQPDGDSNVGPPRYIVDAVISVAVIDLASKPDVLEGSVDARVDTVLNTLLQDGSFIDLRWTDGKPILDSVPAIVRSYQFPQIGESYTIECRLQMTFRFMCFFEPLAPNAFTAVDVHLENLDNTAASGPAVLEIGLEQ
jgi:hypothetical protein